MLDSMLMVASCDKGHILVRDAKKDRVASRMQEDTWTKVISNKVMDNMHFNV